MRAIGSERTDLAIESDEACPRVGQLADTSTGPTGPLAIAPRVRDEKRSWSCRYSGRVGSGECPEKIATDKNSTNAQMTVCSQTNWSDRSEFRAVRQRLLRQACGFAGPLRQWGLDDTLPDLTPLTACICPRLLPSSVAGRRGSVSWHIAALRSNRTPGSPARPDDLVQGSDSQCSESSTTQKWDTHVRYLPTSNNGWPRNIVFI